MAAHRSRAFVEQRREQIVELLRKRGSSSITDLASQMNVSALTIRRDIDALEEAGIARRRYGEALLVDDDGASAGDTIVAPKGTLEAIAQAAADMVRDHELLLINTGQTALKIIPKIAASGVTVVTNSALAQSLPVPPDGMVLITGGEVRPPRSVLSGEFALANIRGVTATTCFLSCAGISPEAGITSTTQQEATVNTLMVERSDRLVVVADSSKFGVRAGFSYATLEQVDLLITDAGAADEDVDVLLEAGIKQIKRV